MVTQSVVTVENALYGIVWYSYAFVYVCMAGEHHHFGQHCNKKSKKEHTTGGCLVVSPQRQKEMVFPPQGLEPSVDMS